VGDTVSDVDVDVDELWVLEPHCDKEIETVFESPTVVDWEVLLVIEVDCDRRRVR
jgi:hypothetical protein